MSGKPGAPRVLHLHGSFAAGDPQATRCVRLIEAFGGRLRHTLVAADGDFGALAGLTKGLTVERRTDFPQFDGVPLFGRAQRIARAMVDHHLVLSYGRAGIGAALAHTSFGEICAAPPLIHHEDGSDESAAQRRGLRSTWLRRVGLGRASGLVVPSETMEEVALERWQQPMGRVKLIPDGVDAKRLAVSRPGPGIGRLLKRPGEYWLGCFAPRGDDDGLRHLLAEFRSLDESWHLVVIGEGRSVENLRGEASRHALDHRVHVVPAASNRAEALALFDLVAVARGREPLPLGVIEAMAAGKPIAGLVPPESAALSQDNAELGGEALVRLAGDGYLRAQIGGANRERAMADRSEAAMVATYRRLYASAMGRDTI